MKKIITVAICVSCLLLSVGVAQTKKYKNVAHPSQDSAELLDRVVAEANLAGKGSVVITQGELNRQVAIANQRQTMQVVIPPKIFEQNILNEMIGQKLLVQAAESSGMTVPPTQLDQAVLGQATAVVPQEPGQPLSSAEILSAFYDMAKKEGYSQEAVRQDIRKKILVNMFIGQFMNKVVTPDEITAYQKAHQAQPVTAFSYEVVLFPIGLADKAVVATTQQMAEQFYQDVKAGKKTWLSGNPQAVPPQSFAQIPQALQPAFQTLKMGEISEPIHDGSNIVLVKLLGQTEKAVPPLPAEEVMQIILNERAEPKRKELERELQEKAYVKTWLS